MVVATDEKVEFRAASLTEQTLNMNDDCASVASALVLGRDRQIVEVASMPVVTCQAGRDNGRIDSADKKQFWLHREFAVDVCQRVAARRDEPASRPKGENGGLIGRLIGTDFHVAEHLGSGDGERQWNGVT